MITNTRGIAVNRAILHVLTKDTNEIFSKDLLELDDIDFNNFLIKHIKSSIGRVSKRRSAKFKNSTTHLIKDNLDNLFSADNKSFIDASQEIANKLNGIIKQKNQGPYYFILCNYENADSENYVAIILLDFSKSFIHNMAHNSAIINHITSLSDSSSKFKKCAILLPNNHNQEFDLIINEPNDTEFFRINFLQSDLYNDDKKLTEDFINNTISWTEDKKEEIISTITNEVEKEEILSEINNLETECLNQISTNNCIDLNTFIDNNFIGPLEDFKESYRQFLESYGLIETQIHINTEIRNIYKINKIKLDNGIQISIPLALINDKDKYCLDYGNGDSANININGKIISQLVKSK